MAKGEAAIGKVIKNLVDKNYQVRVRSAEDLAELGPKAAAAVPALIKALEDSSVQVRNAAAGALRRIGPAAAEAVSALLDAVKESQTHENAILALMDIGPAAAEAIPLAAEWVASPEIADHRPGAAYSMANFGPAAVPALIDIVEHKAGEIRAYSADALGDIGAAASSAVPVLIRALQNDTCSITCSALDALGKIGAAPETVVPALLKLLSADEEEVVRAAMKALGRFGNSAAQAVPELIPMLQEDNKYRYYAPEALGNIGPVAKAALPGLKNLLGAKERVVREAAELAIHRIASAPLSEELEVKLAPPPDATTIDFGRTKAAVAQMISDGIAKFAKEHPDVEISCIALYGQGVGASACLCLETPEHSAAQVIRFPDYSAQNRFGQFHTGVYSFAYSEYESIRFTWWPSLYEVSSDFRIKMPDGRIVRKSFDKIGNEAIDIPLGKLLREVLSEAWPITGLKLAKPFRLGVKIWDSEYLEFWVPK